MIGMQLMTTFEKAYCNYQRNAWGITDAYCIALEMRPSAIWTRSMMALGHKSKMLAKSA